MRAPRPPGTRGPLGITGASEAGSDATATASPTISAYISGASSSTTSTAGSISVLALHNVNNDASFSPHDHAVTATADASAIAISLTAAHAGGTAHAYASPVLTDYAAGTLSAGSAITFRAQSRANPVANADGDSGSLVGLGASNAFAYADGTVYTHFDGSITVGREPRRRRDLRRGRRGQRDRCR